MHPTIEEILRWRVGDPVRADVQRRWQQGLVQLDGELTALQQQVETLTMTQPQTEKPAERGKR